MSTRYTKLVPGEFYHIYNRGNSKQIIFKDKYDYEHFTKLLYVANSVEPIKVRDYKKLDITLLDIHKHLVSVGAYCLMPNHFHILLTPNEDEDSVAHFMLKLCTAYTMYFNKKYNRTGSLYEGSYKSEYVDSDQYLKYLFSYIHLNPIKLIQKDWKDVGIKNSKNALMYLDSYTYSSYLDYSTQSSSTNLILNKEAFPEYFPNAQIFIDEILEWITHKNDIQTTV